MYEARYRNPACGQDWVHRQWRQNCNPQYEVVYDEKMLVISTVGMEGIIQNKAVEHGGLVRKQSSFQMTLPPQTSLPAGAMHTAVYRDHFQQVQTPNLFYPF